MASLEDCRAPAFGNAVRFDLRSVGAGTEPAIEDGCESAGSYFIQRGENFLILQTEESAAKDSSNTACCFAAET